MKNAGFENIVGYNNFPVSEYPGFKNVPKLIKANESLAINPRTHLDVRRV